jgi:glycosyltransferase involved in cell wall biosynthesis
MNEIRPQARPRPRSAATDSPVASFGAAPLRAAATAPSIAVLIPCYNEELTVATVVRNFRTALPEAAVYVYDNNSTDRTAEMAAAAGATVRSESYQGKGNVVRRMFGDIDAEIYLLVDGDDTYDALRARELVDLLLRGQLDMVNAARVSDDDRAFRYGHRLGNRLLTGMVAIAFGDRLTDMLSGYRVFSRRFVKSFPALSPGFEIETELTVHALELRMKITEVETSYRPRREGSHSKLSTMRDGIRILRAITELIKEERPLQFFSALFVMLAVMSVALGWPIVIEYMQTGLVPRFPTAILATGVMLLAFLSLACGLILDTVTHGRLELKRMWYLNLWHETTERSGRDLRDRLV